MPLPSEADQVVLQGYLYDEATGAGLAGTVTATPVALTGQSSEPMLLDAVSHAHIQTRARSTTPDPDSGFWALLVLATNDPDVDAYGGRSVVLPGQAPRLVEVPYDAPQATVTAAQAAQLNPKNTPDGITVGDTVRVAWFHELAGFTAPTPTAAYLTSEQTTSTIATAIEGHDTDPQAHPDIRDLIGTGGSGASSFAELSDVDTTGAAVGSLSALRQSTEGQYTLEEVPAPEVTQAEFDTGLAGKADTAALTAHTGSTANPHAVTKAQVGLGSVDDVSAAALRDRATHTGSQTSLTISDFTEAVQDAVAALLGAGSNVTLNYDDTADTLTVSATGAGGTGLDAEQVRDAIGVALVGVGNIAVTVNDAADTITVSTTATTNSTDAQLRDRSTHTGTQAISTVAGLQSALDELADPAAATGGGTPGRRLAMLGDSITAGVIGAATPNVDNVLQGSPLMYGCMQSAGRLEWGGQFGVPGQTTQQILARVDDVIAAAPDLCLVLAGANDPDLAAFTTYLPQIVDALAGGGIEPVLATRPPSSAVYGSNLGVHRVLRAINGWVTDYAARNGYRLVDFFADLVDPATGYYRAGHNSDVTHPNETGYRVMGASIADALADQVKAGRSWLPVDPLDETGYTPNPLFTADTAGVPDGGWYVAAAGTGTTVSFVTDPDFAGRALLTECTDSSTRAIQLDIGAADWNFQPGDRVALSCKITTSGVEAAGARVSVGVPNNAKTSGPANVVSWQVGADITAGVVYFEDVVPPGTNAASIQIRNDGGNGSPFSYKVGQFAVRSLDRLMGS